MKEDAQAILVDHETHLVPLATQLEVRSIVQQQVLRIREYRFSAGTSVIPSEDEDTRITSHTTLHLSGTPVEPSEVTTGALVFVPDEASVRPPSYDADVRRLVIEMPISRLRSVEETLQRVDEVYLRYQEHSTGHILADLHTKLEQVGAG